MGPDVQGWAVHQQARLVGWLDGARHGPRDHHPAATATTLPVDPGDEP